MWLRILLGTCCTIALLMYATATTTSLAGNGSHFEIPPGIFTLQSQLFESSASMYDDADDFVPYRSDVHDQFSWALMRQILLPTRRHNYTNRNNSTANRRNCFNDTITNVGVGSRNCRGSGAGRNVIFSPFSVKLVLALLAEAAGNGTRTQQQLLTTLGNIKELTNLRSFYRKTLAALRSASPHYTLNLETRLYTDTTIRPQQRYRELLQSYYETPIMALDFSDSQTAADEINSWINQATMGKLQELVTPQNVQHNVMLLINVIYFNGLWRRQFSDSYHSLFYRQPDDTLKVTFMEQTDSFYYFDCPELGAEMLRLPYKGGRFAMFILLPNANQSLEQLFRRLQNEDLKRMQWMMERTKVKLSLPKFKFGHKTDLKAILRRMGIVDIFSDSAELPGIAESGSGNQLAVSNILQKSGIDLNERGTEAFAATEVEIENRFGGSDSIVEFNVNRPFLFCIEEESTGNILFSGKVYEPKL